VFFGLDPGLLGGLALHWTSSAMAQSTIAFVTASVAGKTIKTSSFAQVSAEETYDDLLERTLPGGIPGASAVDIKIYKSSEDAAFRRQPAIDMNSGRTQKIIPVFALALGHVHVVFQVKPATAEPTTDLRRKSRRRVSQTQFLTVACVFVHARVPTHTHAHIHTRTRTHG
jgi:hypothetical protein